MTLALALAHAAKQQPFNGLFYATCATVMPVLFLAIAVQGEQYKTLLIAAVTTARSPVITGTRRQRRAAANRIAAIHAVAILIVTLSVLGKLVAINSLADQQAPAPARPVVINAVTLLTIAVAAPPTVAFLKSFRATDRRWVGSGERDPGWGSGPASPSEAGWWRTQN